MSDDQVPAGTAIAEILHAAGIRRMYAVPGESFLEVLDAVEAHPDMALISTRHESGASFMAEADAKLTGVPAVAAATRGVGAANLAIGVHTAMQDCTPMIVFLGQVDTGYLGMEGFQEVDLPAFYGPITKSAVTVQRTDRIPDVLARAITIAVTGRPGPVLLALPADVLRGTVAREAVDRAKRAVSGRHAEPSIAVDEARRLAERIRAAKAPVVIAGVGAQTARAELVEFAERYGVGVYASFRRQDVFPNDHANYLGHLTLGTPATCLTSLAAADLVLVLGSRLDEVTTQSFRYPESTAEVVHVDIDPRVPGAALPADWTVTASVRALLTQILDLPDAAPDSPGTSFAEGHRAYLEASRPKLRDAAPGTVDPAAAIAALVEAFPADTVVTNDAGNFSAFLHLYWPHREAHTQLGPVSGAMGYGVPAGVAAALAEPGRPVVAVAGDGGFLMSGMEIETAVRCGVDLVVVVLRNGLYGTIAMHQLRHLGRTAGIDIGSVDVAALARSLGAHGISVTDAGQLPSAFAEARDRGGVTVVDIQIDPDLISPTARRSELSSTKG